MTRLQKFLLAATCALVLVTLLPFLDSNYWVVRIWDFPRPQIIVLSAIVTAFLPSALRAYQTVALAASLALTLVLVFQMNSVLPYTKAGTVEVQSTQRLESDRNLKILAANVLMSNRETSTLAAQIQRFKPDLLLLTECDEFWLKTLEPVTSVYPYKVEFPLSNTYGIALYSRFELLEPSVEFLLEDDIPSIHTKVVLPSGELFKLYCLHPRPPAPQESDSTAQRDAELILVAKESSKIDKMPVVVVGDLNDVAWSPTTRHFQSQSGMLDPRKGRGMYNTFHAQVPLLRFPLDHIFHSSHFRLAEIRVLPYIGSDHFPIFVNLSLEDTAPFHQPTPTPTPGTSQETTKTIKEGLKEERLEEAGKTP